ncbi:hypothetical protein SEA_EVANESCE_51 [Mycobacterium phage Evanesce]|uniref:Uncharacterized protein n=13 Tax=Caudoviricetes TaxID=2731619 RepID=A0A8T8JCW9_9CAUD|nr:hypothetical protein Giles_50 [Mycobacterium phage Giles]AHY84236.1 hypothetical protein PBI_HH92_51 [Mycobacterium phage HH92]AKQ07828.1 hypothetical protein SEA_KINBOTE_52 [Mycobacterium phage Kinbote]ALF00272.1 hypothetical protein SEA_EVANESCE_51 [Mycobacterium phage Evanesce]ATN90429.1 hypothetical protein SEA_LILHAZELNUT_52 [Mycobacterium phage LilHazelnut]AYB69393.1 hypothetical protein SEA_GANCHO_51 [Mycobacterium phage Gancho]QDH48792.1 hypothetical protein SEA_DEEPSOIL15_52 [Myco
MSWDGSPQGWRPPAEERSAAEAAEKLAVERAHADARTRELANAIAFGFERVALAIVAAAGGDAQRRFDRMNEQADEPEAFDPRPAPAVAAMRRLAEEHAAAVHDPDLDELLSDIAEPDDAD